MDDAGVHIAQGIHPLKMFLVHSWCNMHNCVSIYKSVHCQIFHKNSQTHKYPNTKFDAYNRFLLNCREHSRNV